MTKIYMIWVMVLLESLVQPFEAIVGLSPERYGTAALVGMVGVRSEMLR